MISSWGGLNRFFAGLSCMLVVAAGSTMSFAADDPPVPPPPVAAPKLVPPRPLTALEAAYPEGLPADKQLEADVVIELTVTVNGSVQGARVVKGEDPYAVQATRAAGAWRFDPATRDGKPIAALIRVLVHFVPPRVEEAAPPTPGESAPGVTQNIPAKPKPLVAPIEVLAIGEKKAPGTVSLGRAEVRLLPGAFGDPFRAIESLPGVTPIFSGVPFSTFAARRQAMSDIFSTTSACLTFTIWRLVRPS